MSVNRDLTVLVARVAYPHLSHIVLGIAPGLATAATSYGSQNTVARSTNTLASTAAGVVMSVYHLPEKSSN